jgi:SOS-response transcriptional repressor LexA
VAEQNEYGSLPVSKKVVKWKKEDYFFVRVEWTSMNDFKVNWKNVENGSFVLIDRKEKVINAKDAFLFVVDNAATLKLPKVEWDNLYLIPKSKDDYHKPIILSKNDEVIVNWKIVDVFNFEKVSV